jgi:hypothetical protein
MILDRLGHAQAGAARRGWLLDGLLFLGVEELHRCLHLLQPEARRQALNCEVCRALALVGLAM